MKINSSKQENIENLSNRWGKNALGLGWVALPSTLIFLQAELQISPVGLNIILNLVLHWWSHDEKPYPSQEVISKRMGISKRTIQREIMNLVEKGIIKKTSSPSKHPRYKGRNLYDLSPLVHLINERSPTLIADLQNRRKQTICNEENLDLNEKSYENLLELFNKRIKEKENDSLKSSVIKELIKEFKNNSDFLKILKERAQIDDNESVRKIAIQELVKGWKSDPDILKILKERAQNDKSDVVRKIAIQELVKGWRDN
jgi:predicted transcriptional regulator